MSSLVQDRMGCLHPLLENPWRQGGSHAPHTHTHTSISGHGQHVATFLRSSPKANAKELSTHNMRGRGTLNPKGKAQKHEMPVEPKDEPKDAGRPYGRYPVGFQGVSPIGWFLQLGTRDCLVLRKPRIIHISERETPKRLVVLGDRTLLDGVSQENNRF